VIPQFLIGFGAPAYRLLEPLAVVIAGLALVLLATRSRRGERHGVTLAGLALAGFGLDLALVAVGIDDLLTRNVIVLWMPAALLLATGLAVREAGWAGIAGAAILCAIGVAAAVDVAYDRNLQRPDWRGVARVLGAPPTAGAGGRAILIQHHLELLPLSLYLPHLSVLHGTPRVAELDVVSFTDPPSAGFCWWGSACNLWPSRMQDAYPIPGFHELWQLRVYQFTVTRLVADRSAPLTRRAVSQALVATHLNNDELLFQRS
jgi:hypothetical protein